MHKEKLEQDLFNKIPKSATVAIFGAGEIGKQIYIDIKNQRNDVNIIGFIDNFTQEPCFNLPVWTLKQFVDKKPEIDLVIMSTRTHFNILNNIFDIFNIQILEHTNFLFSYYRNELNLLNSKNLEKVTALFEKEEDKQLYELLFKIRCKFLDVDLIKNRYASLYSKEQLLPAFPIKHQYLEKINTKAISKILDVGLNSGLNVVAFNQLLPNLEKTYGFEVIYDVARIPFVEEFIMNKKLEIVPYALGDKETTIEFFIDNLGSGGSFCGEIANRKNPVDENRYKKIKAEVITMDKYCSDNNVKPDFIKMDIEGAEMAALRGGLKTIQEHRPQLAISIYHSNSDFINIPLYLHDNLENYKFRLGHYSPRLFETVLYAVPNELV